MKPKQLLYVFIALSLISVVAAVGLLIRKPTPVAPLEVGAEAPALSLPSVQGEHYELQMGDQPILLSFVGENSDSRSQVVFLRSMSRQYQTPVLIVDTTGEDQDALINRTYDWQLGDIPLLIDDGQTSRRFGVSTTPTTYLIAHDGTILQRWEGFASAAQLGLSLQAAVGLDVFGTPMVDHNCEAAPAVAEFAGLPLARSFTENLWAVDGGQAWSTGMPVHWLILAPANETLYLSALAVDPDTGQGTMVIDTELTMLSDEEAQVIVSDSRYAVYEAVQPIQPLPDLPCVEIKAAVTSAGDAAPLLTGSIIVPVQGE